MARRHAIAGNVSIFMSRWLLPVHEFRHKPFLCCVFSFVPFLSSSSSSPLWCLTIDSKLIVYFYETFSLNLSCPFNLYRLRCTDFMQFSFSFSFESYSLHKHETMTFISNFTFYFVSTEFLDTKNTPEKVMNKCHCHSRLKSFIMLVVGVRIPKHSHAHNPPAVNARILNHHNLQQPMAHTRTKPKKEKTIWKFRIEVDAKKWGTTEFHHDSDGWFVDCSYVCVFVVFVPCGSDYYYSFFKYFRMDECVWMYDEVGIRIWASEKKERQSCNM